MVSVTERFHCSSHIPRICGQIMRVCEQSLAPTKWDFSCGQRIVNQLRHCARQVVLLNMHKCLDHCQLKYNWGQECHKRLDHKSKLPWPCLYVTAVSMTLMCVQEDHCSRLLLSFCHIMYVAQADPGSEARRNDFSVPCVLHTLPTIWTVIWVLFLSHVCVWVHYCMLWA